MPLRLKPTDRCCCSAMAGPGGMCQACCGPPIYYAARCIVLMNLLSSILKTGDAVFPLSEVPARACAPRVRPGREAPRSPFAVHARAG